jgi:hypothetical protein
VEEDREEPNDIIEDGAENIEEPSNEVHEGTEVTVAATTTGQEGLQQDECADEAAAVREVCEDCRQERVHVCPLDKAGEEPVAEVPADMVQYGAEEKEEEPCNTLHEGLENGEAATTRPRGRSKKKLAVLRRPPRNSRRDNHTFVDLGKTGSKAFSKVSCWLMSLMS